MPKKKIPNIYIRQYDKLAKQPTRQFLIIALVVIAMLGIGFTAYRYKDLFRKGTPQQIVSIVQKETVSIYYPTSPGKLVEKKIDIKNNLSDQEKGEVILKSLKAFKTIPEAVSLTEVVMDSDGILYLNFSKEIAEGDPPPMPEIIRVFSIVNSFLGSYRNSKAVQFLVEGHPLYTLNGAVYTYKPIQFNQDLLED